MFLIKKITANNSRFIYRLEEPASDASVEDTSNINFKLWVVDELSDPQLKIQIDKETYLYPPNQTRPDVKRNLNISDESLFTYGFQVSQPIDSAKKFLPMLLTMVKGNEEIPVYSVQCQPPALKVIEGKDNYLFLDNDSNRSVDQFTGKYPILEQTFDRWNAFFSSIDQYTQMKFLVIPAKEEIFKDHYPYQRGQNIFIDEFLRRYKDRIVYPAKELSVAREYSYSRTDTHLSAYGSVETVNVVLKEFGLKERLDPTKQKFCISLVAGDLGNKLTPNQFSPAITPAEPHQMDFINNIPNHGQIRVYLNSTAYLSKKIMILGDSFAQTLAPYFAKIFQSVVYLYTAAGIDKEIIEKENPDYILFQSNQRFLISPPTHMSIWDHIAKKYGLMDIETQKKVRAHIQKYIDSEHKFYATKMLEICR